MTTAPLRRFKHWAFGTRLLAIALLGLPLASPAHAIARSGAATTPSDNTADDAPDFDPAAVQRELDSFRVAPVSLSRAMAIAEARNAGSTTADVSFEGKSDPAFYRVKTVANGRMWEYTVSAVNGELIGDGTVSLLETLGAEDRGNLAVLRTLRQRLSDAVRVAERTTSGKAISGGLTRESGKLNFVIVVVAGSDLKQVILEPPGARLR
ncbi:PepSY domain-containing protein [Bradyrhizobium genosp. L]|nr:PepSY domain-containing protein [Bradyrhizobium genosp. L]